MLRKSLCLLAGLMWGMLCVLAQAADITVQDDRGVTHRFAAPPQRIISLLPSMTETVCALGACDRLVGVDRYSSWPARVEKLPRLGGLEDAPIETIIALKPDVVLAAQSARATQRLEALGVRVLRMKSDTHADVQRSLQRIAQLLGRPEQAQQVWAQIERDMQTAAEQVPPRLRGKLVYFEVASAPFAAGQASFIGQTLSRIGMNNIVPAALGPFPKLNPEYIVRRQPDILMAARSALPDLAKRPGWDQLPALQGKTCGLDEKQFEVVTRPGPRLGEAALTLAACLKSLSS